MKLRIFLYGFLIVAVAALLGSSYGTRAVESWTQTLMMVVDSGPSAQGAGVLQVGQVDTLSSAVASATRAQLVAAPTAGKIYVRAVIVEKKSGTPTFTLSYGTGTNCGTGTTTFLGPVTPVNNRVNLDIQVPVAAKALCGATDGATTGIRVLAQ
jgi:hypothetical protein